MGEAIEVLDAFLGDGPAPYHLRQDALPESDSTMIRTILFTDIEDHDGLVERLGDERSREVLRAHEQVTREALRRHGGHEVKAMGDGFLASFGSAARALECAAALQGQLAFIGNQLAAPLRVRIGVNAGEPISEGGDLFGSAVIAAARIASNAAGGEVLVSNVVRELTAGKGFLFSDRGEVGLRGLDDPVRLWQLHI
jgi:class 3 adenylate cyclase